MPKAKLAAQRALQIDDTLPEAHAALGSVLMFYDWDWQGAKRISEVSMLRVKSHGGHFINFYRRFAADALEP